MIARKVIQAGASLIALSAAGGAAVGQARGGGGPAVYWMSADTSSGLAAMAGGGGRPSMGSILRGAGGRSSYVHNLTLQLGSPRRAPGAPSAEHVPPPGLQAGQVLPLLTPQSAPRAPAPAQPWGQMERPRGRMLIYWGCGDHARPGQPTVIDFASMTAGKVPPAFANTPLKPMIPPSAATSATYGEWPNERSQTRVPAGGSLVGDHVVRGNYSPEIRFALGAGQDFLAPVTLTSNSAGAMGSIPLVWRPVPGARAWFGSVMGSGQNGDLIIWTSSETPVPMMAADYVAESDIARLVQSRVLMPSTADRCTVPAEVARAAPQSMLILTAFGGESNFAQPRPAAAARSWRPEWTVKLRTKSTHMGMLGMTMPGMGDDADSDQDDAQERPRTKKEKLRKGLGKILGQ
ncbi:MAG TPA: hypothetical protein VFQ67_11325 [Allosphingosinicella sp.]|jgi:hypothetical protein|nr:hypothetical protein [Allosphingosinicella sp.]